MKNVEMKKMKKRDDDYQVDVLCGGHENTCYNVSSKSLFHDDLNIKSE